LTSAVALAQAPAIVAKPPARVARAKAPSRYSGYVKAWHTPDPDRAAPLDADGRAKLVLYSLNTNDRATLRATSDGGGFAASDLDGAAAALREPSSGNQYPIEPRLLDLVYRIQTHFQAQEIRVISAYRTPRQARGRGSNHGRGRAMDVIVPGASDADVASFARELGFVGVGIYPQSGFVHVDVRERSYFWVDQSGPGKRNRERGILGDLAKKSDHDAALRGEKPVGLDVLGFDVDAALRARAAPSAAAPDDDEDEEQSGL
jgi:uncharacterized protein YcbK (DUF882 family)